MGKKHPDRSAPDTGAPPNAFAGLAALRGSLPAGPDSAPEPAGLAALRGSLPAGPDSAPEPAGPAAAALAGKIVIARERKGRGGKTATLVRGIALDGAALESFGREMRQALGTGGGVEDGAIVLAGEQSARVAQWLRERGATRIVIGN